jgi:hypothetical protein
MHDALRMVRRHADAVGRQPSAYPRDMANGTMANLSPEEQRIGDFKSAARIRRHEMREGSMSERLARLDELCRQMSTLKLRSRGH